MSTSGPTGALTVSRAADEKFCFACGHVIHSSATSCPHCGAGQASLAVSSHTQSAESQRGASEIAPLAANHVYCRGCGAGIHESAHACPKCGAPQRVAGAALSGGRNRVTAALFALLLGGLGAHKFYLGSIFLGLLYLVFFWTAIPALIGLIEGVYYLTLSDEEFGRKYGG
jgi:predicted RNA-binding Zn-ribbon protein involved in translation (DUF1610 family)